MNAGSGSLTIDAGGLFGYAGFLRDRVEVHQQRRDWIIYVDREAGVQGEIGFRSADDQLWWKVYDISDELPEDIREGETSADPPRFLGHQSREDRVEKSIMALAGAMTSAVRERAA